MDHPEETITRIASSTRHSGREGGIQCLQLRWRDRSLALLPDSPVQVMGRGEQSDIRIESSLASRSHARVGFQGTDFVLVDHSTNGTYVQIDEDAEVHLVDARIVLRGHGVISLGRPIHAGRGKLIYFRVIKDAGDGTPVSGSAV